jgi:hypothetical protein
VLIELHRKSGTLCRPARRGEQHCPLIVRPTSEDNISAHLVQGLRLLNPRHWVSDFLNTALGWERFPRQVYRRFRIDLWVTKPPFPRDLIFWDEGSTEVDIQLTWENPPTTVFVEAKYGSVLSGRTQQNDGRHGFPGDQLVRNVRVGLNECGCYRTESLFESTPRRLAVILLAPETGHSLVSEYRDRNQLRAAIPHSDRIVWPSNPFVGEVGYKGIRDVLLRRRRFVTLPECRVIDGLLEYLAYKYHSRPTRSGLPLVDDEPEREN